MFFKKPKEPTYLDMPYIIMMFESLNKDASDLLKSDLPDKLKFTEDYIKKRLNDVFSEIRIHPKYRKGD